MAPWSDKSAAFLNVLGIEQRDMVCLTGAGGKTSLMFHLAEKARELGWKVLVTTTTRILVPEAGHYDTMVLNPNMPPAQDGAPGILVGGSGTDEAGKIVPYPMSHFDKLRHRFDLVLIEADGAAGKPLKGWDNYEPVIPAQTTCTIGVIDISCIGMTICSRNIHRLPQFLEITGAREGDTVSSAHLRDLIRSGRGLFHNAAGRRVVFLNKMQAPVHFTDGAAVRAALAGLPCLGGSVHQDRIYGQFPF